MYTLTNETTQVSVSPSDLVDVVSNNTPICVSPDNTLQVEGHKKEYAIVGDALFASQNIGEAPQWLTSIIDSVIGASLDTSLTSLVEAQRDLVTSIEELQIANNNYNEIVNIDATVDSAVTARVAALNANIAQANATIAELQVTKVSADQASAVALDVISSSLNDTAAGTIGGSVSQLNSSINTLAGSVSSTRTLVESRYGELNAGMADLQISVDSALEGVTTAFAYNSVIRIGDDYYKSGFGLKSNVTTGGSGTQADPYTSEFWIDATKFKFTNSNVTGGRAPFTIDASGTSPNITFTGRVSFTNPAEDLVGAINNGTTTINGSMITTGSISADKISTGVIYNSGGNASNYTMKIDLDNGSIHIK